MSAASEDQADGRAATAGPVERAVDRVELSVPADPAYLAVLRTATAGLAARADMTLDEIEDLRIAVDEACALVLGDAGGVTPAAWPTTSAVLGAPGEPRRAGALGLDGGAEGGPAHLASTAARRVDAVFEPQHQGMLVRVTGPAAELPERSSFAWSVLEALVDTLDAGTSGDGRRSITLRHGSRRAS